MLIAICTRNRERDLLRCLQSIKAMHLPRQHRLGLLIVENNEEVTMQAVIEEADLPFEVSAIAEPVVGYASVRNRSLDAAEEAGAAVLLGIDDDEEVGRNWARAYEAALPLLPHCAALMGPTKLRYEDADGPSTYMQSRYIFLESLKPIQRAFGQRPAVTATQNFLLKREVFDRQEGIGLRFDTRYNATGSEDAAFFMALEKDYEMKIGWVPEARAAEDRKGDRSTYAYYLARNYKHQRLWYQIKLHRARAHKSRHGRIKAIREAWGITLTHLFFACSYAVGAVVHLLVDRAKARRMFGTAYCHLYVATAFREVFRAGAADERLA